MKITWKKITAIMCVVLIITALASGCAKKSEAEAGEPEGPPPSQVTDDASSSDIPDESYDPEASSSDISTPADIDPGEQAPIEPAFGDKKSFTFKVNGSDETVEMTYTTVEDPNTGAKYALYVDLARFQCIDDRGYFAITGLDESTLYVSIQFEKDLTAQAVMENAKERIEKYDGTISNEKEIVLDNYTALYFETEEGVAYAFDVNGGSMYIGVSLPEGAGSADAVRVEQMIKTIKML
jgi:hypothetical protein